MFKIYLVRNQINNKIYIGQTSKTVEWRWSRHLIDCFKLDLYFYRAIRKHGSENFVVKEIDQAETKQEANNLETFYIKLTQSCSPKYGYNGTFGGDGGLQTPEVRKKISTNIKIALADPVRRERKRELSGGENNPMFGRHQSEETKQKISTANTGRKRSPERIEQMRQESTGRKHSEATKLKMSEGAKARNQVSNFTKNRAAQI
jgi:group I intron endonuclease